MQLSLGLVKPRNKTQGTVFTLNSQRHLSSRSTNGHEPGGRDRTEHVQEDNSSEGADWLNLVVHAGLV